MMTSKFESPDFYNLNEEDLFLEESWNDISSVNYSCQRKIEIIFGKKWLSKNGGSEFRNAVRNGYLSEYFEIVELSRRMLREKMDYVFTVSSKSIGIKTFFISIVALLIATLSIIFPDCHDILKYFAIAILLYTVYLLLRMYYLDRTSSGVAIILMTAIDTIDMKLERIQEMEHKQPYQSRCLWPSYCFLRRRFMPKSYR